MGFPGVNIDFTITTSSGKLENTSKVALQVTGLPQACKYIMVEWLAFSMPIEFFGGTGDLPFAVKDFPLGGSIVRRALANQVVNGNFYQESSSFLLKDMFDIAQDNPHATSALLLAYPYMDIIKVFALDANGEYVPSSDPPYTHTYNSLILRQTLPISPNATDIAVDLSSVTVTPLNQLGGRYVQGKSRATLKANATARYGAAITSYKISGPGITGGSTDTATTSFIPTAGNAVYTVDVTDSRGFKSSATVTLDVVPYQLPAFGRVVTRRANSSGSPLSEGTYATANAAYTHTEVLDTQGTDANPIVTALEFKKSSDATWTSVPDGFANGTDKLFGGELDAVAYDVRYSISDQYTTITYVDTVSAPVPVLDFKNGGDGLGIGMETDQPGLHVGWESWFEKPLHIQNPHGSQRWGVIRDDGKVDAAGTAANAICTTDAAGMAIYQNAGGMLALLATAPSSVMQIQGLAGLVLTVVKWGRVVHFTIGDVLSQPISSSTAIFSDIPEHLRSQIHVIAANAQIDGDFPQGAIILMDNAMRWWGNNAAAGQRFMLSGMYISAS